MSSNWRIQDGNLKQSCTRTERLHSKKMVLHGASDKNRKNQNCGVVNSIVMCTLSTLQAVYTLGAAWLPAVQPATEMTACQNAESKSTRINPSRGMCDEES